ncbi:hypothetical protein [Kineobactrum salinum]|uniref:Lipoprotein n=1 Tax=Kineobactrum salinum TaxID=2708301 RepID=A0A6C0U1E1_9GAMM|nr:hypothetical protein [Kineobactrum salinum]QIB65942.1 hypothetical protein G3T16_11425 [Kineobactrum salinum]
MKLAILILLVLLAGCQQGATIPGGQASHCDETDNLLVNPSFSAENGRMQPWRGSQHAGEPSFETSVSNGELTIEKIGTQPWFSLAQSPAARSLRGQELLFRAELKLALDTEGLDGSSVAGGGQQVLIWGNMDPVLGGDSLVYSSTLENEPRLGHTDWLPVTLTFRVPEDATRMRVGFVHQANGNLSIRNPALYRCGGGV